MSEVTVVPALPSGRPETGPMQFGDDWPGVFIRGDNALFHALAVEAAAEGLSDVWSRAQLKGLAKLLRSCSVGNTGWPPIADPPPSPKTPSP